MVQSNIENIYSALQKATKKQKLRTHADLASQETHPNLLMKLPPGHGRKPILIKLDQRTIGKDFLEKDPL
jgi:hypothetical protein